LAVRNLGCQAHKHTADKKSASCESGKNTQQKVVFPNTSVPATFWSFANYRVACIQCRVVVAAHCACLIFFSHLLAFCFVFARRPAHSQLLLGLEALGLALRSRAGNTQYWQLRC
jgi:hypothetical protein